MDDSIVQTFLDQVRDLVPSTALRFGAVDETEDYKKPSEMKANKAHRLDVSGLGTFTGSPDEILKAVAAKLKRRAELAL
jgi:hypothetical protein